MISSKVKGRSPAKREKSFLPANATAATNIRTRNSFDIAKSFDHCKPTIRNLT